MPVFHLVISILHLQGSGIVAKQPELSALDLNLGVDGSELDAADIKAQPSKVSNSF